MISGETARLRGAFGEPPVSQAWAVELDYAAFYADFRAFDAVRCGADAL